MQKGEKDALQKVIREMNWAPLNTTKNETGLVFRVDFHLEEGTPTCYTKGNSAKWRLVGGPSTWPIVKADAYYYAGRLWLLWLKSHQQKRRSQNPDVDWFKDPPG